MVQDSSYYLNTEPRISKNRKKAGFRMFRQVSSEKGHSTYSWDLNTKLVWCLNGRKEESNGLVFKCHLNTRQPNHLNTGQTDAILFSFVLVRKTPIIVSLTYFLSH